MPILAENLSYQVGEPVSDKTNIAGIYDIALDYSTDPTADSAGPPSVFTALQEQLGLRLESTKTAFDFIVVDEVEKIPTDN